MPVSHCCDSRWRMWEDSWKALSLHPRVCSDCFQFPQSQFQEHIPSLCSSIGNHSLCVLPWEPLMGSEKLLLLPASPSLCRVFLRVWARQREQQVLPWKNHPKAWGCWLLWYPTDWCNQTLILSMCAATGMVQQPIPVLRGCLNSPHPPVQYWRGV